MSDYLYKNFFGKYRIMAWLDNNTNDWPRDKNGHIETDDFYIPCKNGALIQHYGGNVLTAYIPSIIKGNRLMKMCQDENIEITNVTDNKINLNIAYEYLSEDANCSLDEISNCTKSDFVYEIGIKLKILLE